jgi:hypothetical protein
MPNGRVPPDTARLRRRLETGTFRLDVDILTGQRVSLPAWIYSVQGSSSAFGLLESKEDRAAVVLPVRGLRFHLRPVTLTVAEGIPAAPATPVHLRAVAHGGVIRLASTANDTTRAARLGLSPAYAWRLLSPFEIATGEHVRWFSALCLALSSVPLGYWGGRTGREGVAAAGLAATAAAGLGVVPLALGFPAVDPSEWAAVAAGCLAGWAAHGAAAYLEKRCALPSASGSSSS